MMVLKSKSGDPIFRKVANLEPVDWFIGTCLWDGTLDMADINQLRQQFADLTVQYEKAVNRTYIASATMTFPATEERIGVWRDALNQEQEIQHQRQELLQEIQQAMRTQGA